VFPQLGHTRSIDIAVFSPDGKRIASGDESGAMYIWDLESGRQIRTFYLKSAITSITFNPEGRLVAVGYDKYNHNIALLDVDTGKITTLLGHDMGVYSTNFSPDGKYIVSTGLDKIIKLWDVKNERLIRTFIGHTDFVSAVFSPDCKFILSGGYDGKIKLWNVMTGNELSSLTDQSVWSIAFSPDGTQFLSLHYGFIKIWDTKSFSEICTINNV